MAEDTKPLEKGEEAPEGEEKTVGEKAKELEEGQ